LSALLHEVQTRLDDARLKVNDKTWLPLGEKFFGSSFGVKSRPKAPDVMS
jgi:hypothetical protein